MVLGNNDTVTMTKAALRALLEDAAEAGAAKALRAIGLHDDRAAHDVADVRSLLEAWRAVKSTALTTAVRALTIAFLSIIVAGLGLAAWPKQ